MKTAFATSYRVLDPATSDGFRTEQAVLHSEWDWYPLRVALVLGAVWHARMQSRLRHHRPAKREAYAAVADAICGMLHRIGDMEQYIDYDGRLAERERNPNWFVQAGLNRVVEDIDKWRGTGVPWYRVSSWAAQWEAMRGACAALEGYGEGLDSALFNAVLDIEALERVQSEHSPGPRHAAVIALCGKSTELFRQQTNTDFMVKPLWELATLLMAVDGSYDLRYQLLHLDNDLSVG